jgi:hypothetical protein
MHYLTTRKRMRAPGKWGYVLVVLCGELPTRNPFKIGTTDQDRVTCPKCLGLLRRLRHEVLQAALKAATAKNPATVLHCAKDLVDKYQKDFGPKSSPPSSTLE